MHVRLPQALLLRGREGELRPWRVEDAEVLAAAWRDPDIAANNPVPETPDLATAGRWIAGQAARAESGTSVDLAMVVAPTAEQQVVGEVGLSHFDERRNAAMIGYWLLAEFRGAGLATAAVEAVTEWANIQLGVATFVAKCGPENVASQRVAERAGFRMVQLDAEGDQLWICQPRRV